MQSTARVLSLPNTPKLEAYGMSDTGLVRKNNEDSFICKPKRGAFLVADGIGGHEGGEIASSIAVRQAYEELKKTGPGNQRLERAFAAAHDGVRAKARQNVELAGMGTTLTMLLFDGQSVFVGHAGDSRAYMLRAGKLHALTQDHSQGGYLMNAVGVLEGMNADIGSFDTFRKDVFLLCSDGLTNAIPTELIEDVLRHRKDVDSATRTLVNAALRAGGPDNVTVLVIETA